MVRQTLTLYFTENPSDKFYTISIEGSGNSWSVPFTYGRRGTTGISDFKAQNVDLAKAERVYNKTVGEKVGKGYTDDTSGRPGTFSGNMNQAGSAPARTSASIPATPARTQAGPARWPVQVLEEIMDESQIDVMLDGNDWYAQQKHDGKRMVLEWDGRALKAYNKKGLQCGCPVGYEQAVENSARSFVLDGESVGEIYWAFDLLSFNGIDQRNQPYQERFRKLQELEAAFIGSLAIQVVMTADNREQKRNLLRVLKAEGREGIVFKTKYAPYQPGIHPTQVKFKFTATCTCLVAAQNAQSSVQISMLDGTRQVPVGNVTIPPNKTKPSSGSIIEVRYLYARRGGSLYQPVYLRPRDPSEATEDPITKLKYKDEAVSEDDAPEAPGSTPDGDMPVGPVMGTARRIRW